MDNDEFLKAIADVESSGGRNIKSVPSTSGMTVGRYQLTQDQIQNLPGQLKNAGIEPSMSTTLMNKFGPDVYPQVMKDNAPVDKGVAEDYLKLLQSRSPDMLTDAYKWNRGPNANNVGTAEMFNTPSDPDYLKKFLGNYVTNTPDTNIYDPSKFEQLRKTMRK